MNQIPEYEYPLPINRFDVKRDAVDVVQTHHLYRICHTIKGREIVQLITYPSHRVLRTFDHIPDVHDPAWCGIPDCFTCKYRMEYDRRRQRERERNT